MIYVYALIAVKYGPLMHMHGIGCFEGCFDKNVNFMVELLSGPAYLTNV
jgi:hypothetical protein